MIVVSGKYMAVYVYRRCSISQITPQINKNGSYTEGNEASATEIEKRAILCLNSDLDT
jgi:hypothetical protein